MSLSVYLKEAHIPTRYLSEKERARTSISQYNNLSYFKCPAGHIAILRRGVKLDFILADELQLHIVHYICVELQVHQLLQSAK